MFGIFDKIKEFFQEIFIGITQSNLESTFDIDEKDKFDKKESTLDMINKFKESIESKSSLVETKQEKVNER